MPHEPFASDLALSRLHALGWFVGSTAFTGPSGLVWVVTCHRRDGEDLIRGEGPTKAVAWRMAV